MFKRWWKSNRRRLVSFFNNVKVSKCVKKPNLLDFQPSNMWYCTKFSKAWRKPAFTGWWSISCKGERIVSCNRGKEKKRIISVQATQWANWEVKMEKNPSKNQSSIQTLTSFLSPLATSRIVNVNLQKCKSLINKAKKTIKK